MRDQVRPGFPGAAVHRGFDDFVILGAIGVGANQEPVAVVGNQIFDPWLARRQQSRWLLRGRGLDHMDFRGHVVMGVDNNKPAALGLANADEKSRVGFLVHQNIGFGIIPRPMAKDFRWPVVFVKHRIENGLVVFCPHHVAAGVGDAVVDNVARGQILHHKGVHFRAGVVLGIHQAEVIGAMLDGDNPEKRFPRRFFVHVKHDFFNISTDFLAAENWVLGILLESLEIGIRPVRSRNRLVVGLDPAFQFLHQRGFGAVKTAEQFLGVCVFRLQIFSDFRL